MPNPFPGMNPYLENPRGWRSFHSKFLVYAAEILNSTLPPAFTADVEESVFLQPQKRYIVPDVYVLPRDPEAGATAATLAPPQTEEADTPEYVTLEDTGQRFLQVTAVEEDVVVAVIELLSPSDKSGGTGHREYLRKQRDLLESETHFLEVDLLRSGRHTVSVTKEAVYGAAEQMGLRCFSTSRRGRAALLVLGAGCDGASAAYRRAAN